jgi:hypothetical protein
LRTRPKTRSEIAKLCPWNALFENSLSTNAPHTQSSLPAKEPAKSYGPHSEEHREAMRLEGWPQPVDSPPSFETRAPDSASALPGGRAPQNEVGTHYCGASMAIFGMAQSLRKR